MTNIFLRAKHWQLFILTFGIPMAGYFFFLGYIIMNLSVGESPEPDSLFNAFKIFFAIFAIFLFILYGWMYSLGTGLQVRIPKEAPMKVNRFKIFFFFQLIYILLLITGFIILFNELIQPVPFGENPEIAAVIFLILFPLHLFAMFCSIYVIYFVAKTIKTIELQREVTFSDFIGEFLLVWLYPIGIWFIQPKINKIIESEFDHHTP